MGDGSQKGDQGGSQNEGFGSQKGDHLSPFVFVLNTVDFSRSSLPPPLWPNDTVQRAARVD